MGQEGRVEIPVCVCVCVCEREGEREREMYLSFNFALHASEQTGDSLVQNSNVQCQMDIRITSYLLSVQVHDQLRNQL